MPTTAHSTVTQPPNHPSLNSIRWLWHHTGLYIPDLLSILADCAVCAELAAASCHHDGHFVPLGRVLVGLIHACLQACTHPVSKRTTCIFSTQSHRLWHCTCSFLKYDTQWQLTACVALALKPSSPHKPSTAFCCITAKTAPHKFDCDTSLKFHSSP